MTPQKNTIFCGGNLEVVASWPSNIISAIVTDPPYGLEFMGKEWDKLNLNVPFSEKEKGGLGGYKHHIRFGHDSNAMQQWHYQWAKAMLRVTKPGGFLLCFGGTRTVHRLTCAIEDAGWEIRDLLCWLFGSGFPKSHNISKALEKKGKNELAKLWKGMGTALKPAYEPILLCEKPLTLIHIFGIMIDEITDALQEILFGSYYGLYSATDLVVVFEYFEFD